MECPTCGDSFGSEHAVKIHHTKAHDESIAGVEVECSTCGGSFRKLPSDAEKYERHFCSDACKSEGYKNTVSLLCDFCGTTFERKKSHAENATRHYCSTECKGKAYRDRVTLTCENCSKTYEKNRAAAIRYCRSYCSDECRVEHMRAAAHPRWKGGSGIAVALRRRLSGESWRIVRREVHDSRDVECSMCGRGDSRNGRALQVHHIVPVMAGGTHHRDNLMLLCHRCHRRAEAYTNRVLDYPISELVDN